MVLNDEFDNEQINSANWTPTVAPAYHSTFFVAEGFESYGKSNPSFSGVSTLAANPLVIAKFNAARAANMNVFYAVCYDCRYSIENNVIRVSY